MIVRDERRHSMGLQQAMRWGYLARGAMALEISSAALNSSGRNSTMRRSSSRTRSPKSETQEMPRLADLDGVPNGMRALHLSHTDPLKARHEVKADGLLGQIAQPLHGTLAGSQQDVPFSKHCRSHRHEPQAQGIALAESVLDHEPACLEGLKQAVSRALGELDPLGDLAHAEAGSLNLQAGEDIHDPISQPHAEPFSLFEFCGPINHGDSNTGQGCCCKQQPWRLSFAPAE